MKKLNELIDCSYDVEISGVKSDSRDVKPGDLFVAIKGFFCDHFDYVEDAVSNGAVAVIVDREIDLDVISIVVNDVNNMYYEILKKYYENIDDNFNLIGITGTDGKTTTSTIISKLINNCCYMGTNGCTYDDYSISLDNTTPDIYKVYDIMNDLQSKKCRNMSMEVSSEALLHKRINGLQFNIVGFTNITEDHLNIHGNINNYIACKMKLLDMLKDDGIAIFNIDDLNIKKNVKKCKNKYYTYGVDDSADFKICKVNNVDNKLTFDIVFDNKTYHINSLLFGDYNAYNITLAFIVAYIMGINLKEVVKKIEKIGFISGRAELLDFGQNFTIILDYAHTENGIFNILKNIRKEFPSSIIITVSGSAGGREKEKRVKMGEAIFKYSDYVIFTMDDPRYEDVNKIIDDMIGKYSGSNYERIIDRRDAIYKALSLAKKSDVVVILGKGRDSYMAIENKKIYYSDYDVLKKYFEN